GPDAKFMDQPWRLHPYQYVDQNPIVYWDPDGRQPQPTAAPLVPAPARTIVANNGIAARIWNLSYTPHELSPEAKALLAPYFQEHFHYDVSQVKLVFSKHFVPDGVQAWTRGDKIVLEEDNWNRLTPRERLALVAHEIAHSVQWELYGNTGPIKALNFSGTR